MRASGYISIQSLVDGVWDELMSAHVVSGSMADKLNEAHIYTSSMVGSYARRTAYTYGPTTLASGATYVPVAGTVVTIAYLDTVAANDFHIVHGADTVIQSGALNQDNPLIWGYVGMLYCDGTNVGIKNGDAAGRDLSIEGFTI